MNRVGHKLSKLYYFFDTAFQKFIYKKDDFFRHFYFIYIFVISRILNAFLKSSQELASSIILCKWLNPNLVDRHI